MSIKRTTGKSPAKRKGGAHPRRYQNPRLRWHFDADGIDQSFASLLEQVCTGYLGLLNIQDQQGEPRNAQVEAYLANVISAARGAVLRRANMRNAPQLTFDVNAVTLATLLDWAKQAREEGSWAAHDARAWLQGFFGLAAEHPLRRVDGRHLVEGLSRPIRDAVGVLPEGTKPAPKTKGTRGRPANDNAAILAAAAAYTGDPRQLANRLAERFHKTPGQIRRILRVH